MNRSIALYGGSFDPVSSAHAAMVNYLSEKFDRVIVAPTLQSVEGKHHRYSFDERIQLLQACGFPGNVEVSRIEHDLHDQTNGYTIGLLEVVSREFGDAPTLIIGSDQLHQIDRWKRWKEIVYDYKIMVNLRPGYPFNRYPWLAGAPEPKLIYLPPTDISSTDIRRLCMRKQVDLAANLIPAGCRDLFKRLELDLTERE